MLDPREIGEWVNSNLDKNIFKFVGVSNEDEVFIRIHSEFPVEKEKEAREKIKAALENIKAVIFVVEPSIDQIKLMLDDLNQFLAEESKPQLLDIGEF